MEFALFYMATKSLLKIAQHIYEYNVSLKHLKGILMTIS